MVKNSSISLFRQILDLVPKHEFEKIIMKHNGNKHKQTFDCWAHFVSMIFCQLAQANSLREICGGLKTCGGKLNHLGGSAVVGNIGERIFRDVQSRSTRGNSEFSADESGELRMESACRIGKISERSKAEYRQ